MTGGPGRGDTSTEAVDTGAYHGSKWSSEPTNQDSTCQGTRIHVWKGWVPLPAGVGDSRCRMDSGLPPRAIGAKCGPCLVHEYSHILADSWITASTASLGPPEAEPGDGAGGTGCGITGPARGGRRQRP